MNIAKLFLTTILIFFTVGYAKQADASSIQPSNNQIPSQGEVISAINQYRQQNGLAPLSSNSLLSSLAQGQSDYQAAIGTITHTGPSGSTPQQRASNAGYGGGSFFYLSEIIYGGQNASVADALAWWKNSGLHNGIMLDSKYTEIGAGVATDGSTVYFTAVLGGPTGSSSGSTQIPSENTPSSENVTVQPTAVAVIPVMKSTPGPDGSIIHVVSEGQSLWTIAAVYEIELDKLLEINGLTRNSFVFPGDKILIQQPGETLTPTTEPTATLTPTSSETEAPSAATEKILGTPFSLVIEPKEPSEAKVPTLVMDTEPIQPEVSNANIVPSLVITAVIILGVSIFFSNFLQHKSDRTPKDDLL